MPSGKMVFEARDIAFRVRTGTQTSSGRRRRFLHARDARRSHRPDRPEWRRQDHAVCGCCSASSRRRRATSAAAPTSQVAYYDQQREQLDPDRTVVDTIGDGNDTVTVNGRPRHVHGYLQDFLFSPERARSPVKALSGGERNRLLLARLFTRPANVLVLDEPTNDLDLETLELLEQQLVEWPGTLLLVSHDRRFLDNVVTSTVVVRRQRAGRRSTSAAMRTGFARRRGREDEEAPSGRTKDTSGSAKSTSGSKAKTKRTFKEEREYAELPDADRRSRSRAAAAADGDRDPAFYKKPAVRHSRRARACDGHRSELLAALERWDALDSIGKP